jgi:single-strand DNA-binding protein
MGDLNKAIVIGHLGADPEVRQMQNGSPVVNLRIATSERWRDKQSGDQRERTEWHRVVIFNEVVGKIAEQYLRKGSHVYVEGTLQTRKWTDQQGIERYSTEIVLKAFGGQIVLLGSKADADRESRSGDDGGGRYDRSPGPRQDGEGAPRNQQQPAQRPGGPASDDMNDEIPFNWALWIAGGSLIAMLLSHGGLA